MSNLIAENADPVNLTATANVFATRDVYLLGFYVNSTSGGTLVLRKGGSGGAAISGTITPLVGFHRFPAFCPGGLHATIAVAALNVTFFVSPIG